MKAGARGEEPALYAGDCTEPLGFRAVGVHCGIKRRSRDLALILSDRPAAAAGVFTRNRVQAAPVRYCIERLETGLARAIVVNSGSANACTGPQGDRDAAETASLAARALGLSSEEVLVASTGVIGMPLPMLKIADGLDLVATALEAGTDDATGAAAAAAILTTDTCAKVCATKIECPEGEVRLGAMAKGAGMIEPNMATTLAFVTTDAEIEATALRCLLQQATDRSFNCITVDGDTSTNDCILVLANGASGVSITGERVPLFAAALERVLVELAQRVVRDGEGAKKFVEVWVTGARDEVEAQRAAKTIANSLLVKTALYGGEPNWGRILAAAGRADVELVESSTRLWFNELLVVDGGQGVIALADAAPELKKEEVVLHLDLGAGTAEGRVWTCDIGHEYVEINGSYIS